MRLLVVTNCQAQVALEVVLQQEQANSKALGAGEKGAVAATSMVLGFN